MPTPWTSPRLLTATVGVGVLALTALAGFDAASATATPPSAQAGAAGGPITLAFGGDVHFEGHVATLLRRPKTSLAALRPQLATADVAVVNLETAVTTRGTPQPKKYRFRTAPAAFTALSAAGVDVVTMANNHGVDYGATGLADTLAARRTSPVRVVGVGKNATDAYAPAVVTVRGRKVAVLGASQLGDWTLQQFSATASKAGIASARPLTRLVSAVKSARRRADVVVVYLHWGNERDTCPDGNQRAAASALVAAGADVVVGSHAHVVQGSGWLGKGYVAYGMGNFIWYSRGSEATTNTGVLTLTVTGRRVTAARWTPLRVSASGVPTAPPAATAKRILATYKAAQTCTGLTPTPR